MALATPSHSGSPNADPKSPPKKPSWFYRHVVLGSVAFVNVPFWSMGLCLGAYGVLFVNATPRFKTLLGMYLLYGCFDPSPTWGGYPWMPYSWIEWLRNATFLRLFAQYFPVSLVMADPNDTAADTSQANSPDTTTKQSSSALQSTASTSSLSSSTSFSPDQSYIFLYHPHGVIGLGACTSLITNACGFDTLQIRRRAATLNACFLVPFYREWMLSLGVVSANKSTLKGILLRKHQNHHGDNNHARESVILLPGGAMEALYAQLGRFRLYLQRRKGFCKLAMETGAALVPVVGFGENQAFCTILPPKDSWLATFQHVFTKICTFSLPLLASPWPQPHPIHVVVGQPLRPQPGMTVDEFHVAYLDALTQLYNREKAHYGHADIPLEIL